MQIRTYSQMKSFETLEDRYEYLRLAGQVGQDTFGFERYMNQAFYRSRQWKDVRHYVIARDDGRDLGVRGHEIYERPLVHHMNPITPHDIESGNADILDPEYLICVSHDTHNAIHYGTQKLLRVAPVDRKPGDTRLW